MITQTAYVYKWMHIPSGKWYIGSRTAKNCSIDDGYICSNKTVKPLILSNPAEWIRTILDIGSVEQMLELESFILIETDAKHNPNSFNLHNGDGKFSMAGKVGFNLGKKPWNKGLNKDTNTIVQKYANTLSKKNQGKKGLTGSDNGMYGKDPWNKGIKTNISPWNKGKLPSEQPFYGKSFSEETKQRLSESQKGSNNSMYGKTPWNKGLTGKVQQTAESNQKRSAKLKGIPRSEEVKAKIRATKAANKLKKVARD